MTGPDSTGDAVYMHGADAAEQDRLEQMALFFDPVAFLPSLRPGLRLLELGCGTGAITRAVAPLLAPGGQVVGVDRQPAQLATAARQAALLGVDNVSFVPGDAAALDLPMTGFDGAYCRFLLEHVSSPAAVLSEMSRLVKPGGWVCAMEWENGCCVIHPDLAAVREVWRAVYAAQRALGGEPEIARRLYGLFTGAGLVDVEARGVAWSLCAADQEKLRAYVSGAREIIGQVRNDMLEHGTITEEVLARADTEYGQLLEDPAAFVIEGYVVARGLRPEG